MAYSLCGKLDCSFACMIGATSLISPRAQRANHSERDPVRLFFALWPDASTVIKLHQLALRWQQKMGGRVMRADSMHITLVFIGNVAASQLSALKALPTAINSAAFEVSLDTAGCWGHNRVAYLGMKQTPSALIGLQSDLAHRIRALGLTLESRVFLPHLTLIRKAECTHIDNPYTPSHAENENPAIEPVTWSVRDFVLVRSSLGANGSRYQQVGRWPLL